MLYVTNVTVVTTVFNYVANFLFSANCKNDDYQYPENFLPLFLSAFLFFRFKPLSTTR